MARVTQDTSANPQVVAPAEPIAEAQAASESAATADQVKVRWNTGLIGISRGYEFAPGHAATWMHDGTRNHPVAILDRAFWEENRAAIRDAAGGTFSIVRDDGTDGEG